MAAALPHLHGKPGLLSLSRSRPSRTPSSPSPHRPIIAAMGRSQSYWASIEADIESHLKEAIPVDRPPVTVFEPMHHLTFAAPRTTAPALCVAACELVGGHRDQAMAAASALRLMHSAAHAHEHLPLTDRPKPKPRPIIHHAFNPNVELLTGDGMVPFGFELLARSDSPAQDISDRILRVIVEITRAVGSQGMVDGQYREITQSDGQGLSGEGWIDYVCRKKEGELHACGAACGAILGGGSEEEIERLRKFGLYVGMIQGMINGVGRRNGERVVEVVEELKGLALKELEGISGRKVESIASLVEADLCNV